MNPDTNHDELRERVAKAFAAAHDDPRTYWVNCLGGAAAAIAAMKPEIDAAYERGVEDGKASMSLDARLKAITPRHSAMEVTIGYIGMLRQTWYASIPLEGNSHTPGERIATCAPTCDAALDMAIAQAVEAKGETNET